MFQYSYTVKNLQYSPAARTENSLLYTCIETFSYTTRVKKSISAQRPNSKDPFQLKTVKIEVFQNAIYQLFFDEFSKFKDWGVHKDHVC